MQMRRLLRALGLTLKDQVLDLAGVMGSPYLKQVIHSSLPPKLHPSRLLTQRFLSQKSIDGAVLSGIVPTDAWAKFTLPKGLPKPGQRSLVIENEPHTIDDFDGTIEAGYGKGTKTLLCSDIGIIKVGSRSFPGKFNLHFHEADVAGPHFDLVAQGVPPGAKAWELHIPRGDYKGRYAFRATKTGIIVVPMADRSVRADKPSYRLKPEAWLEEADQGSDRLITERKMDGALVNAYVDKNRVHMRSHRDTSNTYHDKLPALEFLDNRSSSFLCRKLFPGPDLNGSLFQGEAVHPDGASRVSGIQNALPDMARRIQDTRGPVEFYVWDILKLKGKDLSRMPYEERRALYEDAVARIRLFNKHWHVIDRMPEGMKPSEYFQQVTNDPRCLPWAEGVVLKYKHAVPGEEAFLKVKTRDFYDLEITDVIEGKGKYSGSAGALVVKGPSGELGEVGSFKVNDQLRQWIWDNRSLVIGQTAEIEAFEMTERGVPRAGRFVRFHPDKSDIALIISAESMTGGDMDKAIDLKYAMITANGWHR
jgi:hypothetical protein